MSETIKVRRLFSDEAQALMVSMCLGSIVVYGAGFLKGLWMAAGVFLLMQPPILWSFFKSVKLSSEKNVCADDGLKDEAFRGSECVRGGDDGVARVGGVKRLLLEEGMYLLGSAGLGAALGYSIDATRGILLAMTVFLICQPFILWDFFKYSKLVVRKDKSQGDGQ